MASGMVQINSQSFYPDGPIGVTLGYNGAHGTDIHFFQDLIAMGGTRVRLNIKPDLYAATNMSASPSTWNWGFVDAVVTMANQNNIRCTLIARGFTPSNNTTFSSWQENSSCAPGYTQTTIAGYTKIAVALARRYSGDGNPDNAKDSQGNLLQADCIELGNEEINSMQDSSGYPYTGCRKAMRYVSLVRTAIQSLRAPSSSGGGGWVPRGNFQARIGAWGIVHDQPNEVTSTYGILTHPVLDATYNPSANASSIFGFDSVLGVQMLDYANLHNYNAPDGSGGMTPAAETKQIRGILDGVGNTNIPIWVTEAGTTGPCGGATEASQATYYSANADGSGGGALQALKDAGCQHWDIFTLNYWGGSTNGAYVGQAMSVATLTTSSGSPPNSYVRFQAHAHIAAFMSQQDQGTWAAKPVPAGFGGSTSPPPPPPPGPPPPPPPGILTTVATDTFANRTLASTWGTASDGTDAWVSTAESGSPTYAVSTSTFGQISGAAGAIGVQLLGTQTLTDCDAIVRVKVTALGDNAGILLRANSGGTVYYRCSLVNHILECAYFDGTTQHDIYQSGTLTYKAGFNYNIRFRVVGTTLQGRYWADGTTEPTDFTNASYAFTITDTNLASGKFGLRGRPAGTSNIINFDSLVVSSVGTSSPPPPPPPPPPGSTPQLTGAFSPLASQNINLTNEGIGDWAHWGLTTGTTFDHKSTGGSQVSNFTTVGNGAATQNPNVLNTFTWTDGTPDTTATATATGSKITAAASGSAGAFGAAAQAATPHLMVIALENTGYSQVTGSGSAYTNVKSYLSTYSTCTNSYGFSHPSLPNYLTFASGWDQGITSDIAVTNSNMITATTVVDQMAAAGISWKHYQEYMPSTGYLGGDNGTYPTLYVQHHNPWVYFKSIRTNTAQSNRLIPLNPYNAGTPSASFTNLITDLNSGNPPSFVFVTPGNDHNAHTGTDTAADAFVGQLVSMVQATTWYTSGNGMIVLWWDESGPGDTDNTGIGDQSSNSAHRHGGHTACCVISASNSAITFSDNVNAAGVLRGIQKLYGLSPYLGKAANTINGDTFINLLGTNTTSPPPPPGPPPPPPPPPTTSNLGNGFTFTAPADTNPRTLNVYVDANQGVGTLAASLSDGSSADYYDSSLSNKTAASAGQYALTYAAASSGQQLKVVYTLSDGTTPGTTKSSDTFNRANQSGLGTSSDGGTYQFITESGSPVWSIVNKQAQLAGSSGDTSVALLSSNTLQDCESAMIVSLSNLANSAGLVLRSASSATSYYRAYLTGSSIALAYVTGGVSTILNSQPASLITNTFYWLRFRIVKNSLYAKYWLYDASGNTKEPKNWNVFAIDRTIEVAGQYGFRGVIASSSDTILWDTYSIVDLSSNNDPSYVSLYAADIPTGIATTSGALSVSTSTPSGTIDITSEGTGDWVHTGYPTATAYDRKANVTQLISNFFPVGSGTFTQNTSAILAWSWEDGSVTPTVVASTTETDVGGVANGFSFTVQADTNSRQIFVYVSAIKAQGILTATLSDGSATAYSDSSLNDVGTGSVKRYAITYNAASANQTLTVQWVMLTDNGTGGSLTTYSTDTYVRTNQSGWGTQSDTVNTWTVASGAALPSIVSNKGQITSSTSGAAVVMFSGTGTQANVEVYARYAPSATIDSLAVIARATSSTTYYKAQLSSAGYTITKVVSGTSTDLATASVTPTIVAGSKYWLKFRVNGSNLYSRTWADGSTEPTSWNLTATDTSITGAGQYGLRGRINTSGDIINVDAFTVTNFGAGGGTPGTIGLDAASVPLVVVQGPPPPPPPPQAINATFTVNSNNAITPQTWIGLGVQQDAYTKGTWILNGSFEDSGGSPWYSPWSFAVVAPSAATITKDTSVFEDGASSAKVNITAAEPSNTFHVQLSQVSVSLQTGPTYTVTYWAKADSSRNIDVVLQQSSGPFTVYATTTQAITSTWTQYTMTYVSTVDDNNAQLCFNLAASTGNVWIDEVNLTALTVSSNQRALINSRINYMSPSLIRTAADDVSWWCPAVTGTYTFTTPLMQEWYQVFENAQQNNINVIVAVNNPSPFSLLSSSWCTAFSDLINYLVNDLSYTCIKYVSGLSEPDTNGATYANYKTTIEPQLITALNANNLLTKVQLIGPDTNAVNITTVIDSFVPRVFGGTIVSTASSTTTNGDTWVTNASTDLASTLSGYVRHAFPQNATDISSDGLEVYTQNMVNTIRTNDTGAKPIIQGEMGFGYMGPGQSVTLYQYGVEMADYAVQLARAGMSSLIAYIFDDDMHGTEWGMMQISTDTGQPRPWFFPWSLLSTSLVIGSTIYAPAQPASNDFRALAAQSPQGAWTVVLINRKSIAQALQVIIPFAPVVSTTFQVYTYSNATPLLVDSNGFPLASGTLTTVLSRGFTTSIAANSVLILTQTIPTSTVPPPPPPPGLSPPPPPIQPTSVTTVDVKQPPLPKRR